MADHPAVMFRLFGSHRLYGNVENEKRAGRRNAM
jgi:hypothetical protein